MVHASSNTRREIAMQIQASTQRFLTALPEYMFALVCMVSTVAKTAVMRSSRS